jgi:hypothetical protein
MHLTTHSVFYRQKQQQQQQQQQQQLPVDISMVSESVSLVNVYQASK